MRRLKSLDEFGFSYTEGFKARSAKDAKKTIAHLNGWFVPKAHRAELRRRPLRVFCRSNSEWLGPPDGGRR